MLSFAVTPVMLLVIYAYQKTILIPPSLPIPRVVAWIASVASRRPISYESRKLVLVRELPLSATLAIHIHYITHNTSYTLDTLDTRCSLDQLEF